MAHLTHRHPHELSSIAHHPLPRSDPEPMADTLTPERCAELVRRAQSGDQRIAAEAFSLLYTGLKDELFSFVFGRVRNAHDAEDLFHDIEMKAWSHIGDVQDAHRFRGWLYRIAQNAIADYWRSKYAGAETPREVSLEAEQVRRQSDNSHDFDAAPHIDLPDESIDLDRNLDDQDATAHFLRALRKLPQRQQECLIFYSINHLTYDEIATRLGITPGTVASNISDGRQRLRGALCVEWRAAGVTQQEIAAKLGKLKTATARVDASQRLPSGRATPARRKRKVGA